MGQSPTAMLWFGVAIDPEDESFEALMARAKAQLPPEYSNEEEGSRYADSEILEQLAYVTDGEGLRYPNVEVVPLGAYCIAIGLKDTRESTDWDVRDLGESIDTPEPCDVAPLLRFIALLWPEFERPVPSWKLVGDFS